MEYSALELSQRRNRVASEEKLEDLGLGKFEHLVLRTKELQQALKANGLPFEACKNSEAWALVQKQMQQEEAKQLEQEAKQQARLQERQRQKEAKEKARREEAAKVAADRKARQQQAVAIRAKAVAASLQRDSDRDAASAPVASAPNQGWSVDDLTSLMNFTAGSSEPSTSASNDAAYNAIAHAISGQVEELPTHPSRQKRKQSAGAKPPASKKPSQPQLQLRPVQPGIASQQPLWPAAAQGAHANAQAEQRCIEGDWVTWSDCQACYGYDAEHMWGDAGTTKRMVSINQPSPAPEIVMSSVQEARSGLTLRASVAAPAPPPPVAAAAAAAPAPSTSALSAPPAAAPPPAAPPAAAPPAAAGTTTLHQVARALANQTAEQQVDRSEAQSFEHSDVEDEDQPPAASRVNKTCKRASVNVQSAAKATFEGIFPARATRPYEFAHDEEAGGVLPFPPDAANRLIQRFTLYAKTQHAGGTASNLAPSFRRFLLWTGNRLVLPHLPHALAEWGKTVEGVQLDPRVESQKKAYDKAINEGFSNFWNSLLPEECPLLYLPNQLVDGDKAVEHTMLQDEDFVNRHIDLQKLNDTTGTYKTPFKNDDDVLAMLPVSMTYNVLAKGVVDFSVWTLAKNGEKMPTVLDAQAKLAQFVRCLYKFLEPFAAQLRTQNKPYSSLSSDDSFMTYLAATDMTNAPKAKSRR